MREQKPNLDGSAGLTELELHIVEALRAGIVAKDSTGLRQILSEEHPADIADKVEQLTADERAAFIELAADVLSPSVLAELEDEVLEDVLPFLEPLQISKAITVLRV